MTDPRHKVPQGKLQGKPPKDSSKPKDLRDDRARSMHTQDMRVKIKPRISLAQLGWYKTCTQATIRQLLQAYSHAHAAQAPNTPQSQEGDQY